jgi:tetratricopeptide (TPR) repeat protein
LVWPLLVACDSADSLESIRQRQTQGDFASTLEPLRALLAERPSDPELSFLYGRALIQTQQLSLATWPLRQAMEDPEWLRPAGLSFAQIALLSRDFNEVVEVTTRILEAHPENPLARLYRAQANAHWRKDPEAALADARQVLESVPEMIEAYEPLILSLLALSRAGEARDALAEAGRQLEEGGADEGQLAWHCSTTAVFATDAGELDRARELWEGCLEKFPADATVVNNAIAFFVGRGQGQRAIEILRVALEHEPSRRDLRVALAERLRRAGEIEEGEAMLRDAAQASDPQLAVNALSDLASFLNSDGRYRGAAEAFGQVVDIFRARGAEPPASLLFSHADALVASGQLDQALGVAETITLASHQRLIRARVAQERGDPAGALEEFDEALRLWPNNAAAHYYAGRAAEKLGDFDRALEEYRFAIRASAGATDARTRAARLLTAEGQLLRAYQVLFVELSTAPLEPEGELFSMYLMGRAANPLQLQEALRQLARRRPDMLPEALARGAEGLSESLGPNAALGLLTDAMALDYAQPASIPALRALVEIAHATEQLAVAEKFVEAALRAHPEEASFFALRGRVRELRGEPERAREAYERAVELDGDEALALAGLARLATADDPAKALALFDRALAIDPAEVDSSLAAARILRILGREEEARQRLGALLDVHPFSAEAAAEWVEIDLESGPVSAETLGMAERAVRFGGGVAAYERLARVQAALGRDAEAEQTLARAERLRGVGERARPELAEDVEGSPTVQATP